MCRHVRAHHAPRFLPTFYALLSLPVFLLVTQLVHAVEAAVGKTLTELSEVSGALWPYASAPAPVVHNHPTFAPFINTINTLLQVSEEAVLRLLKASSAASRIAKLRLADTGFEERLASMKERAQRQRGGGADVSGGERGGEEKRLKKPKKAKGTSQ